MLYKAFISYSHAADGELAPALQSALHRFAKPWYRMRAIRVFRDKTSLSVTPALWTSIKKALSESEYFILLASPDAAASHWVQQEVDYWLGNRTADNVLIVLTDGVLAWDSAKDNFDWSKTTAIPQTLQNAFAEEPLYLDLHWARTQEHLSLSNPRFRESIAELTATLRAQPKDELIGEDVRQQRKTKRITWSAVMALLILTLASSVAAYLAIQQKNRAERQAQIALARQLAAQADLVMDQQPNLTERSTLLAVESLYRFHSMGMHSLEADQILRRSLALLPIVEAYIEFKNHADSLSRVPAAFSNDGKYFAAGRGDTLQLWDAMGGQLLGVIKHDGILKTITFSVDAHYLVATTGDADPNRKGNEVWIWETRTSQEVAHVNPGSEIWSIAISRQGKYLITGGSRKVLVWDTNTEREVASMANGGEAWDVAVSRCSKYLAIGSREYGPRVGKGWVSGTLQVWETTSWQKVIDLNQDSPVTMVRFSPDSKYLATRSEFAALVWEVASGNKVASMKHESSISAMEFSPNGKYFGTGSWDGTARVWAIPDGREVRRIAHNSIVSVIAFSPDETQFVTAAGGDKVARVWEVTTGREIARMTHDDYVISVAFSQDGKHLATASKDGTAKTWQIPSAAVSSFKYNWKVQAAGFSPDGKHLATVEWNDVENSGAHEEVVQVWDVNGGKQVTSVARLSRENPPIGRSSVNAVAISQNGKYVATTGSWGSDPIVRVYELKNGQEVSKIPHQSGVQAVSLSPDGKYVATTSDGIVRIWEVKSRREINWPPSASNIDAQGRNNREIALVAFSPDGDYLATAGKLKESQTQQVRVLKVTTGQEVAHMKHEHPVSRITFSRYGKYLAIASNKGIAQILEVSTGREIAGFPHGAEITDLAFSPDENFLATAEESGIARIWEVSTNSEVARVVHEGYLQTIAFSLNGKYLATANGYKTRAPGEQAPNRYNSARLWLWRPVDLIEEAGKRVTRNLTDVEWEFYVGHEGPAGVWRE